MKNIFSLALMVFLSIACVSKQKTKVVKVKNTVSKEKPKVKKKQVEKEKRVLLTDENAIPFFAEYGKKNKENKVRIATEFGDIDILLFEKTPYHRANFIFLTKQKYFDNTFFYRVVPNFIIQGGNSDLNSTAKKRTKIGRYLLPPDTKKGIKHRRGIVSMPSSEIENPHQMASPFEFFIVQKKNGAAHLDGHYTAFGKVIKGMDVVDKINKQETDSRESPIVDISMSVRILEE